MRWQYLNLGPDRALMLENGSKIPAILPKPSATGFDAHRFEPGKRLINVLDYGL